MTHGEAVGRGCTGAGVRIHTDENRTGRETMGRAGHRIRNCIHGYVDNIPPFQTLSVEGDKLRRTDNGTGNQGGASVGGEP